MSGPGMSKVLISIYNMRLNKLIPVLLLSFLLTGQIACSKKNNTDTSPEENTEEVPPKKDQYPGLSVSATGELLLNGNQFRGIGVNYFNAFIRTLEDGQQNNDTYKIGFNYLKERKIPFIRFALNGYWPKNWDLYLKNPDQFFQNLDAFVKAAEASGIGLIPSFFWHTPTLPDLAGEPVNSWGKINSKTHELMRKFIKEVVVRYRDSPAIWGWEQGNEVNLLVDLPGDNENLPPVVPSLGTPTTRSKQDKLYTADLIVMMKQFATEISKYDGSRIIITGNAVARAAAWNLLNNKSWTTDTKEQFISMLNTQNPNPVNVLSTHAYIASSDNGYFGDEKVTYDGLIKASMDAARAIKKPLFLGEFGAQQAKYGDATRDKFMEILSAIESNEVPLSAMWVFDYPPHDTEEGINVSPDNGPREYMLQEIMKVNERISK
ncbi:MAG: hypothetical protein BGP13_07790 [Sphingobacteriales bacterium 40-81]|mgnify:CR=1 FL=1|nr:MAG: hypothetical protein BGP13_07790 [Sphingobacteriales bacterium 40-81]